MCLNKPVDYRSFKSKSYKVGQRQRKEGWREREGKGGEEGSCASKLCMESWRSATMAPQIKT